MVSCSEFKHVWEKSVFPCEVPNSKDYKVLLNGKEVNVYTCRISAYPFNTWWPGHQRPVNQTEIVSYVNIVSDEEIDLEVVPLTKSVNGKVMIKPYSKEVNYEKTENSIKFSLKENGAYVLEIDDYHGLLYIFNSKPVLCENPDDVTYYFGKGVHFPGKITLKSNESVYVDKDALVYGCIFAEDAENIRIFGNGIFDDSGEERFSEHCYEPYTIGNVKFYDCNNISIEGVGFTNSAVWCINIFHCSNMVMDGMKVFGQWRYNTDGVDIVNSNNITIRNSFIHSFDDTITIKGIDRYYQYSNYDMLFEHNVLWCDWGKTCEIGLETAAPEYKNIVFRDCDILRAGNTACDIQNGDNADVHDIVFEDIRMELESFYTKPVLQSNQEMVYNAKDSLEVASVLRVRNKRFREMYQFLKPGDFESEIKIGDPRFAAVHNITYKDIKVYCDEKLFEEYGTKILTFVVENEIPTSDYSNFVVENLSINGVKVLAHDIRMSFNGVGFDILTMK